MKKIIKKVAEGFGVKIIQKNRLVYPHDLEQEFYSLFEKCKGKTMTSTERLYSVYKSVQYIVANKIEGDIVECGVWKGGSSMMASLTLMKSDDISKKLFLYDTYAGMSAPTEKDVTYFDEPGKNEWKDSQKSEHNEWCYSPLDEVKQNLKSTNYPENNFVFVKGKVEDTIPGTLPTKISLLRLDTDWYESTYHELTHLYPLLSENGVLIIDDYGYWKGAREAVDQYFKEKNINILLNRIDTTGRIAIKTRN